MREKTIIPAIIAKNQEELDNLVNKVKDIVDLMQLDVMDGVFVPNNSLDFDFKIPPTNCKYEAHLMVDNPEEWIEKYCEKVDTVLAHFESCKDPEKIIELVKERGKRVGFVLNPETPVQKLDQYLDKIDQVLIMTVNPGFYGSPFLPETLDKVKKLRELKPNLDIEVDGGIKAETIESASKAGANMFVSGSYIMKSEKPKEAIEILKQKVGL
jgi:ribulose-phosphate 3-epimerase